MTHPFFTLRGKLKKQTNTLLEIGGFVLLLLIWQIIASIGSKDSFSIPADEINVYMNANEQAAINKSYVLTYTKQPFIAADLQKLFKELNEQKAALLLVTENNEQRNIQTLTTAYSNMQLMAVAVKDRDQLDAISNFTGSSIISNDFFTADEQIDISTNFLGTADNIALNNNILNFEIETDWINSALLPSPVEVVQSVSELFKQDQLVKNTAYSVYLNLLGYLVAIAIAIPLGFIIGLFPLFRALFSRNVDALRFVPLTAVTGLFIAWFGIGTTMKVQFLAFGIFVYLLPVVVQRIDEVNKVYLQTTYTLGANQWQQIKSVFVPAVFSKVSDDVRVLVAISWTYIIVAELVNASSGGIGALAFKSARMSRIDKVFAILLIIILIGFIQDKLFMLMDKLFFPHKYQQK